MSEEKKNKNIIRRTLNQIEENHQNRLDGKFNAIPFKSFPKLTSLLPGVVKGSQTIITANSGIGKTQLTKRMYLLDAIEFVLAQNNPDVIDLTVHYFALEESAEEFVNSLIINKAYIDYGITFSQDDLLERHADKVLTHDQLQIINTVANELESKYLPYIDLVDSIDNPTGIYKYLRKYSQENGKHYYVKLNEEDNSMIDHVDWGKLSPNDKEHVWKYSHYVPNNPNKYEIVIVDHVSLLREEKGGGLMEAIRKWSSDYSRKQITKHWKYASVLVQQQAAGQEAQQYTYKGTSIESKLEPSLEGLGDNKKTQRDAHVVLGIFAPDRFEISEHRGYNVAKLKDHYRSVKILKNRYGPSHKRLALYYNGAVNIFDELPTEIENYEEYLKSKK